jgi:hypothetical protein
MKNFSMTVDDLNDDGASYLIGELYGVAENGVSSWKVIGALLERHQVDLTYSKSANEWDAQIDTGTDIMFANAANPRLAVARLLVKKTLLENPTNAYTLTLPVRTAFAIGLDRNSLMFAVDFNSQGGVLDEEERIQLDIKP